MFALPVLSQPSAPPSAVHVERTSARAVRLSVTDRCEMACVYCRPSHRDGYLPAEDRLDVDEWERLAHGLVTAGVRRVRITGGEPLLFKGVVDVVRRVAALGVDDLALTTNGSRLAALARPLRAAGLRRITVSIDSLDAARFARITRGGALSDVLAGVDAALACGFDEVKTNTVVLRGENDGELADLARWAWARGITPRFIELMGVGEGAAIVGTRLVGYAEMRAALGDLLADEPALVDPDRGPARYVRSRDGRHRVGFITGTTHTYCDACDRLRVTSDGLMRACLARNEGVDVSAALRAGGGDAAVAATLGAAWAQKPAATWGGCTEPSAAEVSMRATGG